VETPFGEWTLGPPGRAGAAVCKGTEEGERTAITALRNAGASPLRSFGGSTVTEDEGVSAAPQ
jgi:hypothetical protein